MTVAAGAIALSIAGSLAGHGTVPVSYLLASALKLAAGGVAGYASSRHSLMPVTDGEYSL